MSDQDEDERKKRTGIVWQVIVTAGIAIIGALLAAFWSLADPRAEIQKIRDTYLTIREHTEYRDRIQRDIARLEAENGRQVTREELNSISKSRDAQVTSIEGDLNELRNELQQLRILLHEHERDDRIVGVGGANVKK